MRNHLGILLIGVFAFSAIVVPELLGALLFLLIFLLPLAVGAFGLLLLLKALACVIAQATPPPSPEDR